ncbi:peptidoglycan-binding domain-containing protein [Streptomyces olivochromogenes]|uniref:peptidoglycan-binding domain-containing protein n=1 Tax=Streptomyces olivochromogenes TaxID=1963 RepID=UPI001F305C0E|nr:peptidoglycan-binding domain-containing protein [Streptomyces olivochromogenes]MCF3130030.1 peptidoglycan-binding protein [Streptomyces olivochromogenes]
MSTPSDPEQPDHGPVLEPIHVLRPRRFDGLAELMREMQQDAEGHEAVAPAGRRAAAEEETQELPSVPGAPRVTPGGRGRAGSRPAGSRPAGSRRAGSDAAADGPLGFGPGLRRAGVAVAVTAAALVGFSSALLLPGRGDAATVSRSGGTATTAPDTTDPATTGPTATDPAATGSTTPSASAPTAGAGTADPDGAGTLREGNTGPEVVELQQRLLRVPDVYRDGSTDGRYDATLTEAVARYQLWYGISGDETGVYGDDTRRSLESRTSVGDG